MALCRVPTKEGKKLLRGVHEFHFSYPEVDEPVFRFTFDNFYDVSRDSEYFLEAGIDSSDLVTYEDKIIGILTLQPGVYISPKTKAKK